MISYELAKELKDAGFPQKGIGGYYKPPRKEKYITPKNIDFSREHRIVDVFIIPESDSYVYVPTLSELIEACSDGFCGLQQQIQYNLRWVAYESPRYIKKQLHPPKKGEGKTPEEAVAKLWLEINREDG